MLLRRDDFLHIVDHGERDDQVRDDGFLVVAVVDDVDFKESTEEEDSDEQ